MKRIGKSNIREERKSGPLCAKFLKLTIFALVLGISAANAVAIPLEQASVTRIVNDVKIKSTSQEAYPAHINETVSGKKAVQTGVKSRAELLFTDHTLTRLGANTVFNFQKGTREMDLQSGTMLLQVPKGAGGATIKTAAVTAAITGTTIIMEHIPGGLSKIIVLEGTLRVYLSNRVGESTLLEAGQMVILNPNAKQLPMPVDVDIKSLYESSSLVKMGDLRVMEIDAAIAEQEDEIEEGKLSRTPLVIAGLGSDVVIDPLDNHLDVFDRDPRPEGQGDTQNGASVIRDPDPYVVDQNTIVTTNPTITGNDGITHEGTPFDEADGILLSEIAFGSDQPTSVDEFVGINDPNSLFPRAATFRFQNLRISGNPQFLIQNNVKNVSLYSEGDVVFDPGTYTFDPLDSLLITGEKSISVGEDTLFDNSELNLEIYSRGEGETLDFNSKSVKLKSLGLSSGGNINVTAFGESEPFSLQDVKAPFSIVALPPNPDVPAWEFEDKAVLKAVGNIFFSGGAVSSAGGKFIAKAGGSVTFTAANIDVSGGGKGQRVQGAGNIDITGDSITLESFFDEQNERGKDTTLNAGPGGSIRLEAKGPGGIHIKNSTQLRALAGHIDLIANNGDINIEDNVLIDADGNLNQTIGGSTAIFNTIMQARSITIDASNIEIGNSTFNATQLFSLFASEQITFFGDNKITSPEVLMQAFRILVRDGRVEINSENITLSAEIRDYIEQNFPGQKILLPRNGQP